MSPSRFSNPTICPTTITVCIIMHHDVLHSSTRFFLPISNPATDFNKISIRNRPRHKLVIAFTATETDLSVRQCAGRPLSPSAARHRRFVGTSYASSVVSRRAAVVPLRDVRDGPSRPRLYNPIFQSHVFNGSSSVLLELG